MIENNDLTENQSQPVNPDTETTPENTKPGATVQFSGRVFPIDKAVVTDIIKQFPSFAAGFSEVVRRLLQAENVPPASVPVLEPNQFVIELQPELLLLLTKLRRFLKSKGEWPKECTETDFIQQFMEHSLKTYIEKKYSHLI
ncbi:MAG: hypothetical protein K0R26_1920 [Bacteroidota bacterium]|jgi:hypothetical protein|nr:hypothetical protein [Bacteroidota bacterium]